MASPTQPQNQDVPSLRSSLRALQVVLEGLSLRYKIGNIGGPKERIDEREKQRYGGELGNVGTNATIVGLMNGFALTMEGMYVHSMKGSIGYALVAAGLLTAGFVGHGAVATAAEKTSGKATVYSSSFKGKKTANGEKYDSQAMTGASNKFPLGSKVKVKNRKTGKQVVVKINDRTSKKATAAVDLSQGAANKLGVKGTAPVDASLVGKGPSKAK